MTRQEPKREPKRELEQAIPLRLLSKVSLDGGAALRTKSTPQNAALDWLADNANLNDCSDERKIQRRVLATFFFGTDGGNWNNNQGWMRDTDECEWHNEAEGPFCWNGDARCRRV